MTEEKLPILQDDAVPHVCKGCLKWDRFGRNCWVYWEKKKVCTLFEGLDPHKYYNGDHANLTHWQL